MSIYITHDFQVAVRRDRARRSIRVAAASLLLSALPVASAAAQAQPAPPIVSATTHRVWNDPDSLVALAVERNPTVVAARRRVEAAEARVGPAGARPDPLLMVGVQNQPLGSEPPAVAALAGMRSGPDAMTMHMIGISQTIPYPGKLALRARAARHDADAAAAELDQARLGVARDVRTAYYELAYLDASLRIVEQNRAVLVSLIGATEAQYASGTGTQQDVLQARLAIAQLAQRANALQEARLSQAAILNALLDRATDTPIGSAAIPQRIIRVAVGDSASAIRFVSDRFGAPAADSPLPSLATLQELAIANSPMLREHEARIAGQTARVALAERAARPDVNLSLEYGQRTGLADMVSAVVSIPIPLQRNRSEAADAAAARDELAALEAEHLASVNDIRARVATVRSDIDRERTQITLDVTAVLPQAQASVWAATADYQTGRSRMPVLLDAQAALFSYEIAYNRSLADLAESLAQLDALVGTEVLQ